MKMEIDGVAYIPASNITETPDGAICHYICASHIPDIEDRAAVRLVIGNRRMKNAQQYLLGRRSQGQPAYWGYPGDKRVSRLFYVDFGLKVEKVLEAFNVQKHTQKLFWIRVERR